MEGWFEIKQVHAQTLTPEVVQTVAGHPVVIDGQAFTIIMAAWVFAIMASVQGIKLFWLGVILEETPRYERVVPVLPYLIGMATGWVFGPPAALAMTFIISPIAGALIVGPGAGMASAAVWVALTQVAVPFWLDIAPEVVAQGTEKALAKVGIDVSKRTRRRRLAEESDVT